VGLHADRKHVPYKGYNKIPAFLPIAHKEIRREGVDHNVQLDSPEWLRRLMHRPQLLRLHQSTRLEHYQSPRRL